MSKAVVARKKLSEKYDIPQNILEEPLTSGGSTLGNAVAISEWVQKHQELLGDVNDIEIVTNEFHMARAWIMFSMALYKNEFGKELSISEEDIHTIENILEETIDDCETGDFIELKKIRAVFAEYLKDVSLQVIPKTVEDILARRDEAGKRYAEMIRNNESVQRTRVLERNGIRDLIHGRYKVK